MSSQDNYSLLSRSLRDLYDLDEGRRDLAGILNRTAALMREVLDVDLAYAAMDQDDGLAAVSESDSGGPRTETWDGPGELGSRVLETQATLTWTRGGGQAPSRQDFLDIVGAESWIGSPVARPDQPSGLLVGVRDTARPFTSEDCELLEHLAGHVSSAIANLRSFQEVETLAVTDDLTRVYNYRFLKAALRREVERASRYGQVFSIIMLDVDHLKMYNEEHGHLGGSQLLRDLAAILANSSRAIDLVAKYGGDEFLVILPQTRTDGGVTMGNRIREAVAVSEFTGCKPGDITVSVGVASFPEHGATMEALLAAADESLFRAKRAGRNCVIAAEEPGNPARIPELA